MARTRKNPYTKAKAWCRSCRNHGSCKHCENDRTIRTRRAEAKARQEMNAAVR